MLLVERENNRSNRNVYSDVSFSRNCIRLHFVRCGVMQSFDSRYVQTSFPIAMVKGVFTRSTETRDIANKIKVVWYFWNIKVIEGKRRTCNIIIRN